MGVQLINLGKRDAVVGMARNAEAEDEDGAEDLAEDGAQVADEGVVQGTAEAVADPAPSDDDAADLG